MGNFIDRALGIIEEEEDREGEREASESSDFRAASEPDEDYRELDSSDYERAHEADDDGSDDGRDDGSDGCDDGNGSLSLAVH